MEQSVHHLKFKIILMPDQTYTIEQLGQRVKASNPQAFGNFSDQEVGQRVLQRKPELQKIISNPSPNQSLPSQPKQDGFFSGLVKGIAKPFLEVGAAANNVYNAGSDLLKGGFSQNATNQAAQDLKSSYNIPFFGETKPAVTGDESTGESLKKQFGYGAQIASTLMPGAGEAGLGAKALSYGGLNAIGEAGRQATNNEQFDLKKVATSGALGAALPLGGALLRKTAKFGGNLAAEALGKTTGTSADVIREAFNNPNVMKFARASGGNQAGLQEQALEEAQKGLKNIVQKRGNEYVAQLEKIKSSGQETQAVLTSARDHANQLLQDFNITIGEGKKLNNLNFSGSTITKNNDVVQKAFNDVQGWTDTSAAGIDRLQKRLGQFANDIPVTERGGAHSFIVELQNTVKNGLKENVPGYREMTSKYAQASDLIEEIQKSLSLKDSASKDTAIKKLMSTVRENQDLRKEFVDTLGGSSGTDIRGKLAGAALAPWTPRGLTGKLTSSGAGAVGILHPGSIPIIGAYLAAASPRLVGEFTSLLGRIPKTMISSGRFSPAIQNGIRLILQKSVAPQNQ